MNDCNFFMQDIGNKEYSIFLHLELDREFNKSSIHRDLENMIKPYAEIVSAEYIKRYIAKNGKKTLTLQEYADFIKSVKTKVNAYFSS